MGRGTQAIGRARDSPHPPPFSTPSGPTTPPLGGLDTATTTDPSAADPTILRTMADRHVLRDEAAKAIGRLFVMAGLPPDVLDARGPLRGTATRSASREEGPKPPADMANRLLDNLRIDSGFATAQVRNPNGLPVRRSRPPPRQAPSASMPMFGMRSSRGRGIRSRSPTTRPFGEQFPRAPPATLASTQRSSSSPSPCCRAAHPPPDSLFA